MNGQILQVEARSDGQLLCDGEHSKTAGVLPSAAHMISRMLRPRLLSLRAKPPLTPLKELMMSLRARLWSILARKLLDMSSSLESVSASSGFWDLARTINESRAYSLARVNSIGLSLHVTGMSYFEAIIVSDTFVQVRVMKVVSTFTFVWV